jgi:hypothetical protein
MERLPSITAKNELASKVFVVDFDQKQVVVNARFRPDADAGQDSYPTSTRF